MPLKRVLSIGSVADVELHRVGAGIADISASRARRFVAQTDAVLEGLLAFPFQFGVDTVVKGMEIRRAPLASFPYLLHYFVFPSIDPRTLEGLDVVCILSCRHVRQEQPDWETRDPFNP